MTHSELEGAEHSRARCPRKGHLGGVRGKRESAPCFLATGQTSPGSCSTATSPNILPRKHGGPLSLPLRPAAFRNRYRLKAPVSPPPWPSSCPPVLALFSPTDLLLFPLVIAYRGSSRQFIGRTIDLPFFLSLSKFRTVLPSSHKWTNPTSICPDQTSVL